EMEAEPEPASGAPWTAEDERAAVPVEAEEARGGWEAPIPRYTAELPAVSAAETATIPAAPPSEESPAPAPGSPPKAARREWSPSRRRKQPAARPCSAVWGLPSRR